MKKVRITVELGDMDLIRDFTFSEELDYNEETWGKRLVEMLDSIYQLEHL